MRTHMLYLGSQRSARGRRLLFFRKVLPMDLFLEVLAAAASLCTVLDFLLDVAGRLRRAHGKHKRERMARKGVVAKTSPPNE